MHQQGLILLHPTVKEKVHLKENTLFDIRVKVTRNVAQCPLHHVTYAPTEFGVTTVTVTTSKGLEGDDAFTRKFNICSGVVTRNVAQYPLDHMTYSATKFEVATSNRLGGDTFTR